MRSTLGLFGGCLKPNYTTDLAQFNNVMEDVRATETVCRCVFTCSYLGLFGMRVGVVTPPLIRAQPANQCSTLGQTATFSVVAASLRRWNPSRRQ